MFRTLKMLVFLALCAAAVAVVAFFAFSMIHGDKFEDSAPWLSDYADEIRSLAKTGNAVRDGALGAIASVTNALGGLASSPKPSSTDPQTRGKPSIAESCSLVAETNKLMMTEVQSFIDQSSGAEFAQEPLDQPHADAKPAVGRRIDDDKPGRLVDPNLKRFYNGGRRGRTIEEGRPK